MIKRLVEPAIDRFVKDGVDLPSLNGAEALRGLGDEGVVADLATPRYDVVQREAFTPLRLFLLFILFNDYFSITIYSLFTRFG